MTEKQERHWAYMARRLQEENALGDTQSIQTENRIKALEDKVAQLELFVKSIKGPY